MTTTEKTEVEAAPEPTTPDPVQSNIPLQGWETAPTQDYEKNPPARVDFRVPVLEPDVEELPESPYDEGDRESWR